MKHLPVSAFLHELGLYNSPRAAEGQPLPLPSRLPVIDVRSPAEFAQGHIPGALCAPLFTDAERAEIGTLYKQDSREAAVLRGLAHAGPRLEKFGQQLLASAGNNRELAVYCARGGMRSASTGALCAALGLRARILQGGYKAFRRLVLAHFEAPCLLMVLGGKTGSGKTETLQFLSSQGEQVVDLEGLAAHRGSAFGAVTGVAQPSCEHFENRLALALAQCDPEQRIWVEDESENLGRVNLPRAFYARLRAAPMRILEVSREARLSRVLKEYGDMPPQHMSDNLDRIRKRLGGLAHKQAHACLSQGDFRGLAEILLDYYDRAYARQLLHRVQEKIVCCDEPPKAAHLLSS